MTKDLTSLLSNQVKSFSLPALRQVTLAVQKVGGVNLSQGTCQLPVPELVQQAACDAVKEGINRYTNSKGLDSLRGALSTKLKAFNNIQASDPDKNIIVTCGATGAFEGVCATLLNPGDEVVLFEPYYPYHMQTLKRHNAKITTIPLTAPHWKLDSDALKKTVTAKTKFILINTPLNPTGKVFSKEELLEIRDVTAPFNTLLVTDEIYEYMVFDGLKHVSAASLPGLEDRVITMGGYSKTFAITGWRIGYIAAPESLVSSIAQIVDAIYVCPPAPLQEAVARGITGLGDDFFSDIAKKYQQKRDRFSASLEKVGIKPLPIQGAYYLVANFEDKDSTLSSSEFVYKMIEKVGVGSVPSNDFVRDPSKAKWVRFCISVEDSVLDEAIERISKF